ncbi:MULTISPECIES: UdgX family uracil-DNA binding protein [Stenotrophomonas maltophilia group]|uniref:UdgX family uracil-DNA binding protein n=1 Tax=Stenotrophomonas maltophilia group TaxID=995085 RepID=UPI0013DB6B8F|nr:MULTISPECIES: UdgX family uracil-DNA binding protein [Stenotrophomonas]MCO5735804.1 UdgX family uracil-DNA binding protein [Stenotrophomonas maltophilia]
MPHPPPDAQRWSLRVDPPWSLDAWRDAAREALVRGVAPAQLDWLEGSDASLLDAPSVQGAPLPADASAPSVPRDFMELAATCLCHRDPQRLALLYRLLWRIAHGERSVLSNPADADVLRAMALAQAVRRDTHKMKAFVRFREVPGQTDAFIAWFEPDHHIVERVAPFFARRFAGMRWAILTPGRSVYWDGEALAFGPGARREDAPAEDARESLWQTYYASIFNPARLNTRMMLQEMPARYWRHLPEAQLLPGLVRDAADRVQEMHDRPAQAPQRKIPQRPAVLPSPGSSADSLDALRAQAAGCRQCPLWEPATQVVFGQGPADARVMVIGEQPGDTEDLCGRPFAGPAGQLLDRALAELGIDRATLYLTNAVKHFHHERRGKVRLHKRPESRHVRACQPWLLGEIARVRPQVIVCLGATAASSVFGAGFQLSRDRGRWHTLEDGTRGYATVHPAWVLRQGDDARREEAYRLFRDDLARLRADDAESAGRGPALQPTPDR